MTRLSLSWRTLVAGLVLALGLGACDHLTDPDGPNLIDRFGDFTLLDPLAVDRQDVDFSMGGAAVFTARFNKQARWVLEITGQESGAVRRIEGLSNELTAENATWTGRTTELPLFKAEPVEAALFFPDEDGSDTTRVSLTVLGPRAYPGVVIADFEPGQRLTITNPEFEFEVSAISAEVPPAQGDGFLLLRGTDDVVVNNFFIGLVTVRPAGGGFFQVPTTIASELYFNAFLRGFGTPFTIAVVELEIDGVANPVPLGGDVEFPNLGVIDYEGWRAYSEPASSFGQFGRGITDAQTQRIRAVRIVLISDANSQPTPPNQVEFGIDYLTFTSGGPLEL